MSAFSIKEERKKARLATEGRQAKTMNKCKVPKKMVFPFTYQHFAPRISPYEDVIAGSFPFAVMWKRSF